MVKLALSHRERVLSVITSDRNAYVAGHTTPEVKDAVKKEAEKQSISVSKYIDLALQRKLQEDGVPVETTADGNP